MQWKTALVVLGTACAAMAFSAGSASAQANDAMLKRGKLLYFNRGCRACHGIGKQMIAPDLAGLEARRSSEWIHRWLKETDVMLASDSTAKQLARQYNDAKMPKQHLTDQDIDAILVYLRSEEAKMK
jgi:mono/diheme cytochrome c family protein